MSTPLTPREDEFMRAFANWLDAIVKTTRCCPNCTRFDNVRETCDANDDKRPPAKIIAFGCNAFKGIAPF